MKVGQAAIAQSSLQVAFQTSVPTCLDMLLWVSQFLEHRSFSYWLLNTEHSFTASLSPGVPNPDHHET